MAKYKIADLVVEMNTFGRTEKQAADYLVYEEAESNFSIPSDGARFFRDHPEMDLDDSEYFSSGSAFYRQLLHFGGIMLHSSCVVVDDRAYLFSAPSGMGKSTHTELWLKLFGDRAYILNDDKPAIRVLDGKVYVYGTPWSGKYDIQRNSRVALGGIAVLRRAESNSIRHMESDKAIYELMSQSVRPKSADALMKYVDTIGKIVSTNMVYEFSCNMDISAAILSYETMSGKRFIYED